MKILDCTLRDGGYYTNWDFDKDCVNTYIESLNALPIDYIEVGYRSIVKPEYLGKYFYCPVYELQDIKSRTNKELAIIFNEKDIKVEHVHELLSPIKDLIAMVRIAIDPNHLLRAIALADEIKKYGFKVGFNVMYMSKWKENESFLADLKHINESVDYFYMVDSYGGVTPQDVIDTIALVRTHTPCELGFHGHNNLELALINTLTALEHGVSMVDATILGMGRGAGNLKTELLLTYLNKTGKIEVDFNALGTAINAFQPLLDKHQWGTNLPYMISGSNSLPQKDVMDWVATRFYSFNSIVRALDNKSNNREDNQQFDHFSTANTTDRVLIVGGGSSVLEHMDGILEFLQNHPDVAIIHASAKNAYLFRNISNQQYFCLVGNEGYRLEQVFQDLKGFEGSCILPPFPRVMGTYVPASVMGNTLELKSIAFTDQYKDAHTSIALEIVRQLEAKEIFVVGYDGYGEMVITQKEINLNKENSYLFNTFRTVFNIEFTALTPTMYNFLPVKSIYSII